MTITWPSRFGCNDPDPTLLAELPDRSVSEWLQAMDWSSPVDVVRAGERSEPHEPHLPSCYSPVDVESTSGQGPRPRVKHPVLPRSAEEARRGCRPTLRRVGWLPPASLEAQRPIDLLERSDIQERLAAMRTDLSFDAAHVPLDARDAVDAVDTRAENAGGAAERTTLERQFHGSIERLAETRT